MLYRDKKHKKTRIRTFKRFNNVILYVCTNPYPPPTDICKRN